MKLIYARLARIIEIVLPVLICSIVICGCQTGNSATIDAQFSYSISKSSLSSNYTPISYSTGFAASYGVVDKDHSSVGDGRLVTSQSALLVNVTRNEVVYSKSPFLRLYPASTTKVMTAMLALQYGNRNLADHHVGEEVKIEGQNITLADFRVGDEISFDIAMYGAMLRSGNDAAAYLSTFVTSDMQEFVSMMNKEALRLGATKTHFANVHGVHDADHYTTAYDLYLIFNEAIKNDEFRHIIGTAEYNDTFIRTTIYNTYRINAEFKNSNQYLTGTHELPQGIKLIGGKSGTTSSSTYNFVMAFETGGERYILVVLDSANRDILYDDMDALMNMVAVITPVEDPGDAPTEQATEEATTKNPYSDHE